MAKAKKVTKKKAAPKKKAASKKKAAPKKKSTSVPGSAKKKKAINQAIAEPTAGLVNIAPPASLVAVPTVNIPADQLVIELCAPGKRCKQRTDGSFIRQNFISGRWVQVGGTVFSSLAACKNACGG
jgi:hypothetical protein